MSTPAASTPRDASRRTDDFCACQRSVTAREIRPTTAVTGAPAWFELHTRGYAASVRFYQDVFGWDAHVASDTEDFRYTTLGQGEAQQAGIMDVFPLLAEQFPSRWSVYFAVDDADATAGQAVALGGSVVAAPQDSPFGRLATLADPTGAIFKLRAVGTTSG